MSISQMALHLDPRMIGELALGLEPDIDIARRYEFSQAQFSQLAAQDWFIALVVQRRLELQDAGIMTRAKSAMLYEALVERQFQKAMDEGPNGPKFAEATDLLKLLAEVGDVKPDKRALAQVATGPAFTININIPAGGQGPTTAVTQAPKPKPVLDVKFTAIEPAAIAGAPLAIPDFVLRATAAAPLQGAVPYQETAP